MKTQGPSQSAALIPVRENGNCGDLAKNVEKKGKNFLGKEDKLYKQCAVHSTGPFVGAVFSAFAVWKTS